MMRAILICLLALLAAPAAQAALLRQTITVDGLTRHFLLYVPASVSARGAPVPLVMVLHGGGGSDIEVARSTHHRFEALADQAGFIVVYPDAIGRIWDTGEGEVSAALRAPRDDLAFLTAVVADVAARYPVDRSRLFATGISRGAHASYMLACRAPGMFRAIAPVSMTLPAGLVGDCSKAPPTGVLLIEGTSDPIVPYGGGRVAVLGRQRDAVLSADATMDLFRSVNRCAPVAQVGTVGAIDRLTWQRCTAPTRMDRVNGGGHSWPSGRDLLPHLIVGTTNADISAPDEIWAYFSGFPARP